MVPMVQFLLLSGLIKFANSAVSLSLSSPTAAYFTITATVTMVTAECPNGNLVLSNSGGTIYTADTLTKTLVSGTTTYTFTFYYKAAATGTVKAECSAYSFSDTQSITVTQGDLTFSGSNTYVSLI